MYIDEGGPFVFSNSDISNSGSIINDPVYIYRSAVKEISNVTMRNIAQTPLHFKTSTVQLVDNLHIQNCTEYVLIERSMISSMQNSSFTQMGGESIKNGGSLYLVRSNMTISNSNFTENTAIDGGAIYFSCLGIRKCNLDITDSHFKSNKAVLSGGAIKYNVYRPTMQNNIFENNTAAYGPNIGSYAIKIRKKNSEIEQISLDNIGSGVENTVNIEMALYDHDEQIMTLENLSLIEIKRKTSDTEIIGTSSNRVYEGVAFFPTLSFSSSPGSKNVAFRLTAEAIDMNVARRQYGSDYTLNDILVNFRYCKPGEILENNE